MRITRPTDDHGSGPWCEDCAAEIQRGQQLHQWFDKHGDAHWLCDSCYQIALRPEDVRDWKAFTLTGSLVVLALAVLALSGCATVEPRTEKRLVGDKLITVHFDHPATPAACGENWAGCNFPLGGTTVYVRSPVAGHTVKHEIAHVDGMRHGPWVRNHVLNRVCAVVTQRGGGYEVGQNICLNGRGEEVWTDANFTSIARVEQ